MNPDAFHPSVEDQRVTGRIFCLRAGSPALFCRHELQGGRDIAVGIPEQKTPGRTERHLPKRKQMLKANPIQIRIAVKRLSDQCGRTSGSWKTLEHYLTVVRMGRAGGQGRSANVLAWPGIGPGRGSQIGPPRAEKRDIVHVCCQRLLRYGAGKLGSELANLITERHRAREYVSGVDLCRHARGCRWCRRSDCRLSHERSAVR